MAGRDELNPPQKPSLPDSPGSVSRRSFIQTLGASAAVGALADRATSDPIPTPSQEADGPVHGPGPISIAMTINGRAVETTVDPATTLMEALRWKLNLTGTKEICDRGACGGCSVLVDGKLIASCMMLAIDAAGRKVTTIEGVGTENNLDPIQESFIRHDALQCGYCTPGLILASKALLNENPSPSLEQIKRGLSGNICRCGTYTNVFNAVLDASGQAPIEDTEG